MLHLILPCLLLLSISTSPVMAFAEGNLVSAISDDFEDPNWTFDYAKNISSNGLWYGSARGTPTVIERVTPPSGDPSQKTGALRIRTNDTGGQLLIQDDLVTQRYPNTALGRNLTLADAPSYELLIYYPSISEWKDGDVFGFRIQAKDANFISDRNPGGSYHPSIWLLRKGSNIEIRGRFGDAKLPDFLMKNFSPAHPGRMKLGISWDAKGRTKYYVLFGADSITENNLLKTDTSSGRKMDSLDYHFLSLGYPASSGLSPDFIIDYLKVYAVPASTQANITD